MSGASGISAQDYVEIQNLYAYYNLCSDAGDAEGYASCFTANGVLRIDSATMRIEGRADLLALQARRCRPSRHPISPPLERQPAPAEAAGRLGARPLLSPWL